MVDLIKRISETKTDCAEAELDRLLEDLVNLKIDLYHEMFFWAKDLRRPLQQAIDAVEEQLDELNPERVDEEEDE